MVNVMSEQDVAPPAADSLALYNGFGQARPDNAAGYMPSQVAQL